MGLDVDLCQFKDIDTDAILKLWQFSEKPWASEAYNRWRATPESERGEYPLERRKTEYREQLAAKAQELGLPKGIVEDHLFGGTKISFPSAKHPRWPVGEWYSFSTVREMMEYFTGDDFYFIFPEARGIHGLFRPDWAESRERLADFLEVLRKLESAQIEDFHKRFVQPHASPPHLFPGVKRASVSEMFADNLAQIEVMIETLDLVLNSDNPREFLLYWSD